MPKSDASESNQVERIGAMTSTQEKIYEQVNENYRFLAKWRQLAFAGHLAVLAGAFSFIGKAPEDGNSRTLISLCLLVVSAIGFIFWIADRRTYNLTMHAVGAGKTLEGPDGGFFSENLKKDSEEREGTSKGRRKWHSSHTVAARALFLGSAGLCAIAAIVAACNSSFLRPAHKQETLKTTALLPAQTNDSRLLIQITDGGSNWLTRDVFHLKASTNQLRVNIQVNAEP
jgi:hypothetical protein